MSNVNFISNDKGSFVIEENNERQAEMVVGVVGNEMTVYHTGVLERLQGQGIGKALIDAMVEHVRSNNMTVTTYCPFVLSQFKKEPEQYSDIWKQDKPQLKAL